MTGRHMPQHASLALALLAAGALTPVVSEKPSGPTPMEVKIRVEPIPPFEPTEPMRLNRTQRRARAKRAARKTK